MFAGIIWASFGILTSLYYFKYKLEFSYAMAVIVGVFLGFGVPFLYYIQVNENRKKERFYKRNEKLLKKEAFQMILINYKTQSSKCITYERFIQEYYYKHLRKCLSTDKSFCDTGYESHSLDVLSYILVPLMIENKVKFTNNRNDLTINKVWIRKQKMKQIDETN